MGQRTTLSLGESPVTYSQPPRFPPGSRFAGRFTIIEQIGVGGMGEVYKAIDQKLNQQEVALKLILPEFSQHPSFMKRFRTEVRLTRQISHPNVCRIHDIGEHKGTLYLSMQWIDGETLRKLMRQAGRLEEGRALQIAEKIAKALGAAHARRIIHRDLKPENVMVDHRGDVFVMDFGLAKELLPGQSQSSGIVGTPGYMAPEQMRGEKVSEKVDLYALGLILQEMLTGKPPGRSLPARSGIRSQVGSRIAPVVEVLLAEDPQQRPGSAKAVTEKLRHIRQPGRVSQLMGWTGERLREHRRWLTLGGLAIVAVLILWSRIPPPQISEPALVFYERGMHYLTEGGAGTGTNLKSAINMFRRAIQHEERFADAWAGLGLAYWGLFDQTKERASMQEAKTAVQRALDLDPELPQAREAHAQGLIVQGKPAEAQQELLEILGSEPDQDRVWALLGESYRDLNQYSEGHEAIQKAISLNPGSSQHRVSLGTFFNHFEELEEAVKAYGKAIELKPDNPLAWSDLGGTYLKMGRFNQAVEALLELLAREENADGRSNLGTAYFYLEDYPKAEQNYRSATTQEPSNYVHWANLADALRMLERPENALAAYQEASRLGREASSVTPLDAYHHIVIALCCARVRDDECALQEGNLAVEMEPKNASFLLYNAVIRATLDQYDEALDFLEKAVEFGISRGLIENDPDLQILAADPRYQQILELAP